METDATVQVKDKFGVMLVSTFTLIQCTHSFFSSVQPPNASTVGVLCSWNLETGKSPKLESLNQVFSLSLRGGAAAEEVKTEDLI